MTASRAIDAGSVLAALEAVPDPEIPTISIVELGMVGSIDVDDASIRVTLLPTFVGCPALELIRDSVAARLAGLGRAVHVDVSFATPWSTDRISPAGRQKLRRSGFAPPPHIAGGRSLPVLTAVPATAPPRLSEAVADPISCPHCGSLRTTLENAFGPTQCRSIRHCAECRQPFEAFKPI